MGIAQNCTKVWNLGRRFGRADHLHAHRLGERSQERWRRCGNYPQQFGSTICRKAELLQIEKDAQEAHEAVRPTDVSRTPEDVRKYWTTIFSSFIN